MVIKMSLQQTVQKYCPQSGKANELAVNKLVFSPGALLNEMMNTWK